MTLQEIASVAGVDAATVHRDLRRESEIADAKSEPAVIVNARGQQRPTTYKPRAKSPTTIFATSQRQMQTIMDAAHIGSSGACTGT